MTFMHFMQKLLNPLVKLCLRLCISPRSMGQSTDVVFSGRNMTLILLRLYIWGLTGNQKYYISALNTKDALLPRSNITTHSLGIIPSSNFFSGFYTDRVAA